MADGEDIGEYISRGTIMEEALTSGSPPKKSQSPTILPFVSKLQQDDVLPAKGKKGVKGDVSSPSILEELSLLLAELKPDTVDLICRRLTYLATLNGSSRGSPHQPKDMQYALKVQKFIKMQKESSVGEILSKEMDLPFLRQLLEDILDTSLNAEKGVISPDPALAALAAAPSRHRRGNADELFASIP